MSSKQCNLNIKIKGKSVEISEGQLVDILSNGEVTVEDLVANKLDAPAITRAQIKSVQRFPTGIVRATIDGQPVRHFTTQSLIDSDLYKFRGRDPILKQNKEEYIKELTAEYMASGLTEEEAIRAAEHDKETEEQQGEDGRVIHGMLNTVDLRFSGAQPSVRSHWNRIFEKSEKEERYKQIPLGDTVAQLTGIQLQDGSMKEWGLNVKLRTNHKIDEAKTDIMQDITLRAKIAGIDEEVVAHFDTIVIDSKGSVHVYNYKTSRTDPSYWGSVKKQKYWHQMALLKQILAYNGFDITDTQIYFVPVRVEYTKNMQGEEHITNLFINKGNLFAFPSGDEGKKYMMAARNVIPAKLRLKPINSEKIERINTSLNHFFPERGIRHIGVLKTAKSWIRENFGNSWYSNIRVSEDPKYAYELFLENEEGETEPILIKDPAKPEENKEIIKYVTEYLKKENSQTKSYLKKVLNNITTGMFNAKGITPLGTAGSEFRKVKEAFIRSSVSKYLTEMKDDKVTVTTEQGITEEETKQEHAWELIQDPTLSQANIALFRHKVTGQLDVVVLSDYDLKELNKQRNQRNIMGPYIMDASMDTRGLINYESTFGNIEALRAMVILNEILPSLQDTNIKLGELKVISTYGEGMMEMFSLETLNKDFFQESARIVKKFNKNFKFQNNFARATYVDPIEVLSNTLLNCLQSNNLDPASKDILNNLGISNLFDLKTKEAKKVELAALLRAIEKIESTFKHYSAKEMIEASYKGGTPLIRSLANIYLETSRAMLAYQGVEVRAENKLFSGWTNALVQNRVPNKTYQEVISLYTSAIDKIASRVREAYAPIHKYTMEFYEAMGYGSLRNSTLGDNARAFENLYRLNDRNEIMMEFRNPYENDTQTPLNAAEKTFLKRTLFQLAKIKSEIYGFPFDFSSAEDPKLLKFIEKNKEWYFLVPLEKASQATQLTTGFVDSVKEKLTDVKKFWKDGKEIIDKYINGFATAEEAKMVEDNIKSLSVSNSYMITDGFTGSEDTRRSVLEKHGPRYWETNVENLLGHYLEKAIQTEEYSKVALTTKAILIQLEIMQSDLGSKSFDGIEQTKKLIKDFIQMNVYGTSIMEETSKKILTALRPLTSLVSKAYIAANITSAVRDSMEGVMQNTMRSLNHYQTDINSDHLAKGYAFVLKSMATSSRNITLIDELCRTYRLSNVDVARISEGLSTSRSGLANIDNLMYSTLRQPDFLNRMSLFVAKAIKDGTWQAFSLKDGLLHYNWKLDKRFSVYADQSKKGTPEWLKQRAAYYNAIRQYNQENPESTLKFSDDLPAAYSNQEMQQLRQLSNSIYGSYDKSLRSKYEAFALGSQFTMYSTWMNGIVANYFSKPGQYPGTITDPVHDTDGSGNLLFFDENGEEVIGIEEEEGKYKYIYSDSGKEYTGDEKNLSPMLKNVPRVCQGIVYTLGDIFDVVAMGRGDFKADIWNNPIQRANLKKFGSDIFMMLFYFIGVRLFLQAKYRDYKKDMKNHSLIQNMVTEVSYNAFSKSWDGFLGILAPATYLGESTNPPVYRLSATLTGDLVKIFTGKETPLKLAQDIFAPLRTFRASWKAEAKKKEENITPLEKELKKEQKAEEEREKRIQKQIEKEMMLN